MINHHLDSTKIPTFLIEANYPFEYRLKSEKRKFGAQPYITEMVTINYMQLEVDMVNI